MAQWPARTQSEADGIISGNALYSCKNVSQKNANHAEAVTGAVNDVGLPAAAKSASPGANSEDARHFLLQTTCTDGEKGRKWQKCLQLANVLDLLDNLSVCLRVCVRATNCISLWGRMRSRSSGLMETDVGDTTAWPRSRYISEAPLLSPPFPLLHISPYLLSTSTDIDPALLIL